MLGLLLGILLAAVIAVLAAEVPPPGDGGAFA